MNVLDSSAWLAILKGEANGQRFTRVLADVEALIVPTVCIAEVARKLMQGVDRKEAEALLGAMQRARVADLTAEVAVEAARVGLEYRLHLADSIIYATARLHDATLWTQDAHFANLPGVEYLEKPAPPGSPP